MDSNLSQLLANLKKAFAEEATVKQRRIELEAQIADLYKNQLPEQGGSKTFEYGGFRFSVKQDYTFKADLEGIKTLPASATLIRVKEEFNAPAYKQIWKYNPIAAKAVAAFVTATPGKPSVKIEEEE